MKKTLLFTAILTTFSYVAIADGNKKQADTKKDGEAVIKTSSTLPTSLLDNVLLKELTVAKKAAKVLKETLTQDTTAATRSANIDRQFSDFVSAWKIVQTNYVAGELDADMLDTPRLMDAYHEGKEDLVKQLERAVKSGDTPKIALFKNTFKSINALGFYLYADSELSTLEKSYAIHALGALLKHLDTIEVAYTTHRENFLVNSDMSMSYVLNALIDSSYKLKEWRVGDPAGLSRKYKGNPDNRRQEYPYSKQSLNAIDAILTAHDDMMGERDFENLGRSAIVQGANKEVKQVRKLIADAKQQVAELAKKDTLDFSDNSIKNLYVTLKRLNDTYYQSLVKALPVQAKILDADGD